MQWFLIPVWGWLGLLAIPLILLYLLRQKRPEITVPSTLLWNKALSDFRASHPFQKFRRNLLLFIQLLALTGLVLSLMRPVLQGHAHQASAGVVIISAGASMQTLEAGGNTRIALAKEQGHKLINSMRPGDQMMLLIDGGGGKQVRTAFLSSKEELNRVVDQIVPTDIVPDLSETLQLANTRLKALVPVVSGGKTAEGKPSPGASSVGELQAGNIWLISDGVGVQVPPLADLNLRLRYLRIGENRNNVGIVKVGIIPQPKSVKGVDTHSFQIFVSLANSALTDRDVYLGVRPYQRKGDKEITGKYLTKVHVVVPGAKGSDTKDNRGDKNNGGEMEDNNIGTTGLTLENIQLPADINEDQVLQIVLAVRSKDGGGDAAEDRDLNAIDALALDNTAFVKIPAVRKMRVVLVTKGNQLLENFLQTVARLGEVEPLLLSPEHEGETAAINPDFVIYDAVKPSQWPGSDCLVIHPSTQVEGFTTDGQLDHPVVLRWQRDDPLMNYVELGDLRIAQAGHLATDPNGEDWRELISSPQGPLLAARYVGGVQRYYLAFNPLTESNWWMHPSLLVFLENALRDSAGRRFIGTAQILATGQPAGIWLANGGGNTDKLAVETPEGELVPLGAKTENTSRERVMALSFPATELIGVYHVLDNSVGGKSIARESRAFVVNLQSRTATNITPRNLVTNSGENVDVLDQNQAKIASVNQEIWPWVALAVLLILVLEWWVYHKRWA